MFAADAGLVPLVGPLGVLGVFLWFEGAGGVEDAATRGGDVSEEDAVGDDLLLDAKEGLEGVGAEAIAGLGATGEDAGVGAGDIEQDEIGLGVEALLDLSVADDADLRMVAEGLGEHAVAARRRYRSR